MVRRANFSFWEIEAKAVVAGARCIPRLRDGMTNDEIRMTKEARMTKHETRPAACRRLVIRASSFFRHSSFVIRHFPDCDEAQVAGDCRKLKCAPPDFRG